MTRCVFLDIGYDLDIAGVIPDAPLEQAYTATLSAIGGRPPYSLTLTAGAVGTGHAFTDNGDGTATLAGTATVPGVETFTVTVEDADRLRVTRTYSYRIAAEPLTLSLSLPDATAGAAYSGSATANGGVGTYVYTKVAGPAWMSVNSATGAITGTPDEATTTVHSVTIRVTDDQQETAEATQSMTVTVVPPIVITGTFPNAVCGTPYDETLPITGGTGTYSSASVLSGSKPPWATLEISGSDLRLHGMPDDVGATWTFVARVTDSGANTGDSAAQSVENTGDAWTPADLVSAAYLIFDDQSTVTVTGGECSQWNDRSGNDYHASTPNATERPTINATGLNGLRTLAFDDADDRLSLINVAGRDIFQNATSGWVFAVARTLDDAGSNAPLLFAAQGINNSSRVYFQINNISQSPSVLRISSRRLDGGTVDGVSGTVDWGEGWHCGMGVIDWSGGTTALYVDGEADGSISNSSSGSTSDTISFGLGVVVGNETSGNLANSEIAVMIAGRNAIPSSADIARLFGWAAHRYALTDNLDSSHTYKMGPPIKAP